MRSLVPPSLQCRALYLLVLVFVASALGASSCSDHACPVGTYKNGTAGDCAGACDDAQCCVDCDRDCANCTGPGVDLADTCVSCKWFKHDSNGDDPGGTCASYCDRPYYLNATANKCFPEGLPFADVIHFEAAFPSTLRILFKGFERTGVLLYESEFFTVYVDGTRITTEIYSDLPAYPFGDYVGFRFSSEDLPINRTAVVEVFATNSVGNVSHVVRTLGPADFAPTCFDLTENGDEEGVDCGGPCEPCTYYQWGISIHNFSSEYGDWELGHGWSSIMMLGPPDVYPLAVNYGDIGFAWTYGAYGSPQTISWNVCPTILEAVDIVETYKPGGALRLDYWDTAGARWVPLWNASSPNYTIPVSRVFSPPLSGVPGSPVSRFQLTVDTTHSYYEVDAVRVVGYQPIPPNIVNVTLEKDARGHYIFIVLGNCSGRIQSINFTLSTGFHFVGPHNHSVFRLPSGTISDSGNDIDIIVSAENSHGPGAALVRRIASAAEVASPVAPPPPPTIVTDDDEREKYDPPMSVAATRPAAIVLYWFWGVLIVVAVVYTVWKRKTTRRKVEEVGFEVTLAEKVRYEHYLLSVCCHHEGDPASSPARFVRLVAMIVKTFAFALLFNGSFNTSGVGEVRGQPYSFGNEFLFTLLLTVGVSSAFSVAFDAATKLLCGTSAKGLFAAACAWLLLNTVLAVVFALLLPVNWGEATAAFGTSVGNQIVLSQPLLLAFGYYVWHDRSLEFLLTQKQAGVSLDESELVEESEELFSA